jgi:ATP-dependent helicase/nuclease subunit A
MDRDQAVGNLLKLRDIAAELAHRPDMTFARFVRELARRVTEVPPEAEFSMAEDETDREAQAGAVRLMSMHKAKGLEFPVVILAGLHRIPNRQSEPAFVHHDWSTGITGVRVGRYQTMGGLYTATKLAQRRSAEHIRLLYVGMTRAKRKLVLSAGLPSTAQSSSFLGCIARRLGLDLEALSQAECDQDVACGDAAMRLIVRTVGPTPAPRPLDRSGQWHGIESLDATCEERWAQRRRRYTDAASRALFLTPTALQQDTPQGTGQQQSRQSSDMPSALRVGTLAHRLLERWDFSREPSACIPYVKELLEEEWAEEPFEQCEPLREEITLLMTHFVSSPLYRDLQRATIIGREVPFLMPWDGGRQTMSGTIDLLYRLDGRLWIADYKTDRVEADDVPSRIEQYRTQAEIYAAAMAAALGAPVSFQFVFLRAGLAMTVQTGGNQ